jgi:hypothetical protein
MFAKLQKGAVGAAFNFCCRESGTMYFVTQLLVKRREEGSADCSLTVHEWNAFIALGLALSEKQNPRFVEIVSS